MAKVKYDVSGDIPETGNAPVGTYRGKIKDAEAKDSNAGNPMIVISIELTHHADGKKVKEDYWPVRQYLMVTDERPYAKRTIKEFTTAIGLKPKGTIDTDKILGKAVQVKLKSDTDQDGEYQPRIQWIRPLDAASEEEPEDEAEPEEPEVDEDEDDDEDEIDLDAMDRKALKALIKEEELEITVKKSMSEDDLRELIAEAMGDDDEEEDEDEDDEEPEDDEEDDEEEDGDDDAPDYDSMSVNDLKAELKERELATNGSKKVLIQRLKKDDDSPSF